MALREPALRPASNCSINVVCSLGLLLAAPLIVSGCDAPVAVAPPVKPTSAAPKPMRIVSLDFCADQFVLALVERERIIGVSTRAREPYSFMAQAARGLPQPGEGAEAILPLKPDLVVRSYGGGPQIERYLAALDIPVLNIPYAGDLDAIGANMRAIAAALGATEAGAALADAYDARLHALRRPGTGNVRGMALYVTPSGVTAGPGTMVDAMIKAAGLSNFQTAPGWQSLPLEALARNAPDVVIAAQFGAGATHPDRWSAARHPLYLRQAAAAQTVSVNGAWLSCGGWFLLEGVAAMAGVR